MVGEGKKEMDIHTYRKIEGQKERDRESQGEINKKRDKDRQTHTQRKAETERYEL